MATYPLTPLAFSTIVETDPTELENANKLGEALRQTRHILKNLALITMNDDGSLKSVALLSSNSVNSSAIQSNAVTTAKIADINVTTAKLVDLAITSIKLADAAVTTAKIADINVTTGKLADAAVTTIKINDKAVTSAKLANDASVDANRSVTSDSIKDSAVIERTIASNVVSAAKLKSVGSGYVYLDSGAGVELLQQDTDGDVTVSKVTGKAKFVFAPGRGTLLSSACLIVERGGSNANAGTATANTFNVRPAGAGSASTDFVKLYDPLGLFDFVIVDDGGNKKRIKFLQKGTYYAALACVAFKVNDHFARLVDKTADPDVILLETMPYVTDSTISVQSATIGEGIFTIPVDNTQVQLEHWVAVTRATDGLGRSATLSGAYPATNSHYVNLLLIKLDN